MCVFVNLLILISTKTLIRTEQIYEMKICLEFLILKFNWALLVFPRWHLQSSNNILASSCTRYEIQFIILLFNLSLHCWAPLRGAGNISVFTIYMRNPDRSQVWQCQHVNVTMAVTCHGLSIAEHEKRARARALGTTVRGINGDISKEILKHTNSSRCLAGEGSLPWYSYFGESVSGRLLID